MPYDPRITSDFNASAKEALAKAGTIGLPYPPPASGQLYLGIDPTTKCPVPGLPAGSPRFFLRIVHRVSGGETITRIIDLKDLRGISLPPEGCREGSCTPWGGWRVFWPVDQLADAIAEAIESLKQAAGDEPKIHEVCLFDDAVIYVPEIAPVFLRIVYEHGVTAAESAEHAPRLGPGRPDCDCSQHEPHLGDEP